MIHSNKRFQHAFSHCPHSAFDASKITEAVSLENATEKLKVQSISAEQLWGNLEYFLNKVIPVAEEAGVIPATIRRLGEYIRYVHFRDVRGTRENFAETFHDNGPTDMVEAMRAYRDIGFDGPIRPDHVPQLVGEGSGEPGYTMMGRLFA